MSVFHNFLRLGPLDARQLSMQFDAQLIAALIIFLQGDQRPHFGIFQRRVEFFGGIEQGAVVTS